MLQMLGYVFLGYSGIKYYILSDLSIFNKILLNQNKSADFFIHSFDYYNIVVHANDFLNI